MLQRKAGIIIAQYSWDDNETFLVRVIAKAPEIMRGQAKNQNGISVQRSKEHYRFAEAMVATLSLGLYGTDPSTKPSQCRYARRRISAHLCVHPSCSLYDLLVCAEELVAGPPVVDARDDITRATTDARIAAGCLVEAAAANTGGQASRVVLETASHDGFLTSRLVVGRVP